MTGDDRILVTQRLVAAPCQPKDRDSFERLERDPEVMRFLNGGAVDDSGASVGYAPFLMPRGTESDIWTICRRSDGGFVGWMSLLPGEGDSAVLGYRLCRSAWGEGLATEGALALLDWGFAHAGYGRITAQTMAVNLASRRVLEKSGMHHIATRFVTYADPIPGSEHGEAFYELSRGAWAQSEANSDLKPP